jgi:hypothetical protein
MKTLSQPGGRIARFPLLISRARENNGIRRAKVRPYSNNLDPRTMVYSHNPRF